MNVCAFVRARLCVCVCLRACACVCECVRVRVRACVRAHGGIQRVCRAGGGGGVHGDGCAPFLVNTMPASHGTVTM